MPFSFRQFSGEGAQRERDLRGDRGAVWRVQLAQGERGGQRGGDPQRGLVQHRPARREAVLRK